MGGDASCIKLKHSKKPHCLLRGMIHIEITGRRLRIHLLRFPGCPEDEGRRGETRAEGGIGALQFFDDSRIITLRKYHGVSLIKLDQSPGTSVHVVSWRIGQLVWFSSYN